MLLRASTHLAALGGGAGEASPAGSVDVPNEPDREAPGDRAGSDGVPELLALSGWRVVPQDGETAALLLVQGAREEARSELIHN